MSRISQLKKYRYYWWKTGNMHPKAKWEEADLPYELAKDVPFDTYVKQTDKYNIHGFWEWENGTVRVIELPSSFHETCISGIVRQINRQLGAVEGTNADIFNYGATTTKSRGSGKEADASFRPVSKPQVNRGGSDGNSQPWPNLVVEVAYSQEEAVVRNKIEDYWLRAGRAHDAILIKIEPPTAPNVIPEFMTAKHYCINNRTATGALQPIVYDFSTTDDQGNPTNLQPGQRVINIQHACLYHGVPANILNPPPPPPPQPNAPLQPNPAPQPNPASQPNPVANLPNPIIIDLYLVQYQIINCIV
ncbi:hypothetical protein RclHR1_14590002 [Rhizophagus clarus]|nr:hypothetical protein RclHR1_14590002 [Rhizophagus clarus]